MNFKSLTLSLAASLACLSMNAAQAQSLFLSPATQTVDADAGFTVQVLGSSFANTILGGGFELNYDATVVRLDMVTIDPSWEFGLSSPENGGKGAINNAAGTLSNAFFATNVSPKAGNFLAATLKFTAIGDPGSSTTLALAGNALQPFVEERSLGETLDVTYQSATVTISNVPEPSSLVMLLAGAGGLAWVARRKQQG
jgi:PEP-CTERM motif